MRKYGLTQKELRRIDRSIKLDKLRETPRCSDCVSLKSQFIPDKKQKNILDYTCEKTGLHIGKITGEMKLVERMAGPASPDWCPGKETEINHSPDAKKMVGGFNN